MKTSARNKHKDDMSPEYDFSDSMPNKYFGKLTKDSPVYIISSRSAAARKTAKPANGRSAHSPKKRARKK